MGKGSKRRPENKKKIDQNWDRIFGNNTPSHDALEVVHTSRKNDPNPNSVGYYGYNEKTDNFYPELDD